MGASSKRQLLSGCPHQTRMQILKNPSEIILWKHDTTSVEFYLTHLFNPEWRQCLLEGILLSFFFFFKGLWRSVLGDGTTVIKSRMKPQLSYFHCTTSARRGWGTAQSTHSRRWGKGFRLRLVLKINMSLCSDSVSVNSLFGETCFLTKHLSLHD